MTKKLLTFFIILAAAIATVYLVGSFCNVSFNMAQWEPWTRLAATGIVAIIAFVTGMELSMMKGIK